MCMRVADLTGACCNLVALMLTGWHQEWRQSAADWLKVRSAGRAVVSG